MNDDNYDWSHEAMSDTQLDEHLNKLIGTDMEIFIPRLKKVYQRLRAEVAEEEVPELFKKFLGTMKGLNDERSE